MDLNAVRMFVAVVQAGSISASVERLGVPLPTVSRRIRELERELKVQLLERSARGIRLTDAGTRLYEYASRGIETLAEAEQALKYEQARLKGRLRLSLPPAFEAWWDLLRSFQQHYPDIQLHVYTTERRVDLIEDGIDVALRVGSVVHESMVARRIMSYRHLLVASPGLAERLGWPEGPEALYRFPCAIWSTGAFGQGKWRLGDTLVEPEVIFSTNDYAHLYQRALSGDVVTELPPFLAAGAIQERRLVALLPDYPMPEQQVNLLYPSHRHPSALVRTYLDFCQQYAPGIM